MKTFSDLLPYQLRGIEFVKNLDRCALWEDMGLGKSVQTLTAFDQLRQSFDVSRMLVVAPATVARDVWSKEVQQWEHLTHLRVSRVIGTEKQRIEALKTPADIYTISRDNLTWLEPFFLQQQGHRYKQIRRFPWDMIVLDESQSFKNQSALRSRSIKRLRALSPRLVELTGTPSPNGYGDLWHPNFLLDRGERLGRTEGAFLDRFFNLDHTPDGYTKRTLKAGAAEQIQALVADLVLSLKAEDYLTLPPIKYNPILVTLKPAEIAKYKELERHSIMETAQGRTITAENGGVLWGKLLQLANGAIYYNAEHEFEVIHNAKIESLLETIEFLAPPVLIAYGFQHDLQRLTPAIGKVSNRTGIVRSEKSIDAWNRGEFDYALIHPGSAGHGLNLQFSGAENLVWFGLTPNLEHDQQLTARLAGGHRRANRNLVVHHILAAGTKDEDAFALLTAKGASQDDLTGAIARIAKEAI